MKVNQRAMLLIAGASIWAIGAASAAERHGWYVGVDLGASFVNDIDMDKTPNHYAVDHGIAAFGMIGYKFVDPSLRLEVEGGYRMNDLDTLNNVTVANGELSEITGFVNLLWDLSNDSSRWGAVLGGGIGIDNTRFKDQRGIDSIDYEPAAQAIAGLSYKMNDHWDIDLTYRYMYVDVGTYISSVGVVPVQGNTNQQKHALTLGFRWGYDDPPPPPPVQQPPAPEPIKPPPPKQFIIFFGFNKCNITAEADAVLSEAAAAAKSMGSASVKIVGHTDSSGSAKYNQKLSECRADAAKANLVGKGVSEGSISTSGKGESELMVQTGDGVKEPQNRRATVDLN